MSAVRVRRHRATVTVRPHPMGDYDTQSVEDLERAVIAACRAINTTGSQDLLARIVGADKVPNPPAAAG